MRKKHIDYNKKSGKLNPSILYNELRYMLYNRHNDKSVPYINFILSIIILGVKDADDNFINSDCFAAYCRVLKLNVLMMRRIFYKIRSIS